MRKTVKMEHGMKNRRYKKTEESILQVFFDENNKGITMQRMAKKASIGRSTIYTHHHAIREIIPDYERYILLEYRRTIQKRLRLKNITLKSLYLDTLLFILRNKKTFAMFLKFKDRDILVKMIKKLEKKINTYTRFPERSSKMFLIYANEISVLIEEWEAGGFKDQDLTKVLTNIMYLTDTARSRLLPVND